jgi:hypothetical protein
VADPVGNNPVNNVANFRIDFKGGDMDIQTMFLALSMERAEYLDLQMKDQAAEMQHKNQVLREATAALTAARQARQNSEAKKGGDDGKSDWAYEPKEYTDFVNKYGAQFPDLVKKDTTGNDTKHNVKEWDVNIESLKGFLDFHNSQSQTDMIKLQSLQNKFNQCFESASNQMSKQAKGLDTIIGNLR